MFFQNELLDAFIKNFISCKTRLSPNLVKACYPLLSQVNNELFKTLILPALQKAMLRNPEIILETVGLVISGVDIDLNNFALEISKNLIGMFFKILLHTKGGISIYFYF